MTEQPTPAAPAVPDAAPTASPPAGPTPTPAAPAVPHAAPAAPAPVAPAESNAAPAAPVLPATTQGNALVAPRRSHRASGASRDLRERLDGNEILISLALLGEATKMHLTAIHFPSSPLRRIERHLQPLMARGLVERRTRYAFDKQRGVPVPSPHAYRLSSHGHELVTNDPRYPIQTGTDEYRVRLPNPTTTQVQEHDLLGTEAISWLVVLARGGGLSGMFLRRELQLDPQSRAPRIDAVLVCHFGGPQLADGAFAWTKNPPADDEQRVPLALEVDRNTEAISVIRGKAVRYQEALERQRTQDYWATHYGRVPIIFWIAPTERRLAAIHRAWLEAWPDGEWALATIADLAHGRCQIYHGQTGLQHVLLFNASLPALGRIWRNAPAREGVQPPAPALPPPAPEPPTPPPEPPPPSPEEVAAEVLRESIAALMPPPPRTIAIQLEEPPGPSGGVPVANVAVIVRALEHPDVVWEGRLWHPRAAPSRLDLGMQFANTELELTSPDLTLRGVIAATRTQVVVRHVTWPVVPPHHDALAVIDAIPPWDAPDPWMSQMCRYLDEMRASDDGLVGIAVLGLGVLTLFLTVSIALWRLVVAVADAVLALVAWVAQELALSAAWLRMATQPVGGPRAALVVLGGLGIVVVGLVAARRQIPELLAHLRESVGDYLQEHQGSILQLIMVGIVALIGFLILRPLFGGI